MALMALMAGTGRYAPRETRRKRAEGCRTFFLELVFLLEKLLPKGKKEVTRIAVLSV